MKKFLLLLSCLCVFVFCGCSAEEQKKIVIYDLNGGNLISGQSVQFVDVNGTAIPPLVERDGFSLSWSHESSNITNDVIISAVWTPQTYDVVFELNGGTLISGETTQKVKHGEAAQAPKTYKEGMSLSWDVDFSCVTNNLKVNASWEKAPMSSLEIAEYALERTAVIICDDESVGTGFFIDDKGTLITNFHVIRGAEKIEVELYNGAKYEVSSLVSFSHSLDLAKLKINCSTSFFELQNNVALGEQVYTVGTALGFLKSSFTSGIISSTSRNIGKLECYQMDAPISSGNSGGPLINQYGEVIGVSSYSYTLGNDLHLAIKISEIDKLEEKNFSLKEYDEWCSTETGHSYSPFYDDEDGEYTYYYSLINTYQYITGDACIESWDDEKGKMLKGYHDCCQIYIYNYNKANYDKYIEYIKSIGFEFDDEYNSSGSQILSYYSPLDNVYIDLLFYTEENQLWISVYY